MVKLLTGDADPNANSGPYVDGAPLQGQYGLLLAMHRKALYDLAHGPWYVRLDAAHWILNTMPDLVGAITGRSPRSLRLEASQLVPEQMAFVVARLRPLDLLALARLVASDGRDVCAYAYALPWKF